MSWYNQRNGQALLLDFVWYSNPRSLQKTIFYTHEYLTLCAYLSHFDIPAPSTVQMDVNWPPRSQNPHLHCPHTMDGSASLFAHDALPWTPMNSNSLVLHTHRWVHAHQWEWSSAAWISACMASIPGCSSSHRDLTKIPRQE